MAIGIVLAQTGRTGRSGRSPEGRAPRSTADAGPSRARPPRPVLLGTDPPGKLRPWPDAGPAPQDAGPSPLQQEVQQLRARVDALEQERSQIRQQSQQLEQIVQQLRDLRGEIADSQQRQREDEAQQQAQKQQLQAGVEAAYQAQTMLAGGNSAVESQLDQAQAAFPPQAQRDVQAARYALRNRDLSAARAYLSAAIVNAQQGR